MRASLRAHFGKRVVGIGLALVLLGWLALPHAPAHAATFTVTKTTDTNDGACNSDCSLREAVVAANAADGADTIEIPSGYYKRTILGADDTAAGGDLDITSELALKAMGPVTVDANGIDRVVHVLASGKATLSGLWITGGSNVSGAGIRNSGGTLTLTNSTVSGNQTSTDGGGIYNANSGTAIVTKSTVSGNSAVNLGGGILNENGTFRLRNSRVNGNEAGDLGGGISNSDTLTLTKSTVTGNESGVGGGIYNAAGTATLTRSTVSGNEGDLGAAIFNAPTGTANLTNSTVSGNESGGSGGGIYNTGTVTLTRSTVSGNSALDGGGIHNTETVTMMSSTVSGNSADNTGGGISNSGGTATIAGSTITDNRSDADGNNTGDGGGIIRTAGTVSIGNSILAGNFDGPAPDCSGEITSNDYNLIGSTTGCTVTPQANDDIGAVALGPLAFNGGPTETHPLPGGSTAINHGPTSGSGTDQRGVVRPVGAAFDTGAYERVLCSGLLVNVVGTNAKDTLTGTARADGVLAQGGNDTVRSGAGSDKACGGNGNDKLFGEGGNDTLLGEGGNDLLDGGPGSDVCVGGPGTDELKSC
jgi:CSLREA domain-containing protein